MLRQFKDGSLPKHFYGANVFITIKNLVIIQWQPVSLNGVNTLELNQICGWSLGLNTLTHKVGLPLGSLVLYPFTTN